MDNIIKQRFKGRSAYDSTKIILEWVWVHHSDTLTVYSNGFSSKEDCQANLETFLKAMIIAKDPTLHEALKSTQITIDINTQTYEV
jgi:hypothetical protein